MRAINLQKLSKFSVQLLFIMHLFCFYTSATDEHTNEVAQIIMQDATKNKSKPSIKLGALTFFLPKNRL